VNVVAIACALAAAWTLSAGEEVAGSISRVELSGALTPRDTTEPSGQRAFNVLLVGYDSASNLDSDDPIQIGRQGEQAGDVIIIARIDERTETAQLLSIPRDLWVPIAGLDREAKINSAFAVGGARMLIETIEDYFDIPINNFVSVDLAGFEGLVSVVDHVDLFFEHPSRDFSVRPASGPPRSMTGFEVLEPGCQSLQPKMALALVRSRSFQIEVDGVWVDEGVDDLARIRRQQLFLEAFLGRAIDLGARNPFVLKDLVEEGSQYVTLDQNLTPQMLLDIGKTFDSFEPEQLQSYSVPTRYDFVGAASVLFDLEDETAPLVLLMQGVDETDPQTVGVSIRSTSSSLDGAGAVAQQMRIVGFEIDDPRLSEDAGEGVSLEFGPDGAQAADLVQQTLSDLGVQVSSLTEVAEIVGREVEITFGTESADQSGEGGTTPRQRLRRKLRRSHRC